MAISFLVYDLIFLFAFAIFFFIFLYTRRKNLKKEGLLYMYRTSWGIKLIDYLGKKHPRTLKVISYASIISGYILMAGVLVLIYRVTSIYIFQPSVVRAIKVPPLIPLVPYLPQVFKLQFLLCIVFMFSCKFLYCF